MTELAAGGVQFFRMLVTQLRAGNLFRDRDRQVTRTVARVQTFCRVYFDAMDGQPDHLDFSLEGPDARQWAARGVELRGVGGLTAAQLAATETSWEHRDTAAREHQSPYPRP